MADPEFDCPGTLVQFDERIALCDLGDDCKVLFYRGNFETYRAAHPRTVTAEVAMDPDGEFEF
jgi:hypothetical protein